MTIEQDEKELMYLKNYYIPKLKFMIKNFKQREKEIQKILNPKKEEY